MIHRAHRMGAAKPVLSHYTRTVESAQPVLADDKDRFMVPTICQTFFNERGVLSFYGAHERHSHGQLHPNAFVAGGFCFCDASFLRELPYDPNLPYLFVGEEILHSARFFTHGWDIFTPSENIAFHEYTRTGQPKVWDDNRYSDAEAVERVKRLMDVENYEESVRDAYGLGRARTLRQYYQFAGVDPDRMEVTKNFCGNPVEPSRIDQSNGAAPVLESRHARYKRCLHKWLWISGVVLASVLVVWIVVVVALRARRRRRKAAADGSDSTSSVEEPRPPRNETLFAAAK